MKVPNTVQTVAIVGVVGYLLYNKFRDSLPKSAADAINTYYTSVITNPDGSVDVPATLGITNNSTVGNIGGHNATGDEVRILQYAHNYGVQIAWKNTDFGNNPEVDYATTLRDVALAAGMTPVTNWFGFFSQSGTLSALDTLQTVTQ